jgi:hypothetical protein
LDLTTYITHEVMRSLRAQYIDDRYIHHVLHHSTKGYVNGRLAFLYLKRAIPSDYVKQARRGLAAMSWYSTNQARRKCLAESQGHTLEFGHIDDSRVGIRQFVPTIKQRKQYKMLWPLLDRMDGTFQRHLPRQWRENLLAQRGTDFTKTATAVSTFSTITCLRNAPTSLHVDSKNADAGMTVLTTAGDYSGGEFCFPQYGVSIPIQPGDVLIAATHREWHCNFKQVHGMRYSIIGYFREGLKNK